MTMLVTEDREMRTVAGFANGAAEAIEAAGQTERCVPHGLRTTAAYGQGNRAVTGRKSPAEVERYTAAAVQERHPREAMRKRVRDDGVANSKFRLPNRAESRAKSTAFQAAGAPKGNRTPVFAVRGPYHGQ